MARGQHIISPLRGRYDPNEDWMPQVSELELSRRRFYAEHPEEAPAVCPIPACGYRGTNPGRPCPNVGKDITGKYGTGPHGPIDLVEATR